MLLKYFSKCKSRKKKKQRSGTDGQIWDKIHSLDILSQDFGINCNPTIYLSLF